VLAGMHSVNNLDLLEGCHSPEDGLDGPFVWAPSRFQLRLRAGVRTVSFRLAYLGTQGTMQSVQESNCADSAVLREGWQDCFITVPPGVRRLSLEIDPVPKVEGDDRELAVMIREITLLDDNQQVERARSVARNAVLNDSEFRQGLSELASYPPNLRITAEVRCNIPETSQACAYCAWDWAKAKENGSPAFTLDSIDELGGFYRNAHSICDCSIGEPLMHKQFDEILFRFNIEGKHFSFTTNGQLLVERRRRQLLGKDVEVYVSLDSATLDGFSRYRNDRFETIITNLRSLCAEKRQHGGLPKVIASFIAMRSNIDELNSYLRLMMDVGVDLVKLRSLYLDDNVAPITVNNGYRFDYATEVLSKHELAAHGARAQQSASEIGLPLYVEWDQFEPEADTSSRPLCAEPWKTIYVLARGIMPCCYATEPIAKWTDQGERSLDEFLHDVFNSGEYQNLRRELAAGRLAPFCRSTPSCPVAKRAPGHPDGIVFGCGKNADSQTPIRDDVRAMTPDGAGRLDRSMQQSIP
jgi:MoaA/NifB/PqqE/SkfB family radical SAM enzyme